MKWFEETTVWAGTIQPNHVYLLNDSKSKMYAYRARGSDKNQVFKNPIRIDIRGRKFKPMPAMFDLLNTLKEPEPLGKTWYVVGSKGEKYTVNEQQGEYSCSCTGFKFRGQCKHVSGIRSAVPA